MSETDTKVMSMVERELKKNPKATVDELFTKAKALTAAVGNLTKRQFHARYPLQVKRKKGSDDPKGKAPRKPRAKAKSTRKAARAAKAAKAAPKPKVAAKAAPKPKPEAKAKVKAPRRQRMARASAPKEVNREKVRSVLLGFASDLTAAEQRKDLVKVLAGVDRYVDRVIKATR